MKRGDQIKTPSGATGQVEYITRRMDTPDTSDALKWFPKSDIVGWRLCDKDGKPFGRTYVSRLSDVKPLLQVVK